MDLYMECLGKNKSSWNVRLMRHENHIKIEMMKKQKKTQQKHQHQHQQHIMMDGW